jgi:hypothetical protein
MAPLRPIRNRTMNMYGGVKAQFQAVLTSALDGGKWSASSPTALP